MRRGFQSVAQQKWAHSKEGLKQLGKKLVDELDKLTKRKLPKRVK